MVHSTGRWVVVLTLPCLWKWQQVLALFSNEQRCVGATVQTCWRLLTKFARRSSNGIEHFRTDEGSDWKSGEVAEVVRDRGIHHQHALVCTWANWQGGEAFPSLPRVRRRHAQAEWSTTKIQVHGHQVYQLCAEPHQTWRNFTCI